MLFWFPKDGERVKQHGKLNIGGVKGSGGHGGGQGSSSQVPRERCMLVLLLWQARTGGGGGADAHLLSKETLHFRGMQTMCGDKV